MAKSGFETLRVFQRSEQLADEVWRVASAWGSLARDTIGKQLIRAVDSIGANIAEGTGRGNFQDNRRFVKIARGSLYETKNWLRRAFQRSLLSAEQIEKLRLLLDDLCPMLNSYLKSIGPAPNNPPMGPKPR